ncbi:hypothetical protein [Bosea sp. 117]|uniref:hypothetical protein n=1 Tax=Bosea sp. 117 TaxID=1125973 RepID=UPI00049482CA|nr:hypothetical protein [Bosea sp. 117]
MKKTSLLLAVALVSGAGATLPVREAGAWVACGPAGCAAGRPRVYAPPRGVVVVTPRRYWRPGGAIAAGAAIGFVAGAAAASLAGPPPQPGYCWYYTNPQRTTGFWDVCP